MSRHALDVPRSLPAREPRSVRGVEESTSRRKDCHAQVPRWCGDPRRRARAPESRRGERPRERVTRRPWNRALARRSRPGRDGPRHTSRLARRPRGFFPQMYGQTPDPTLRAQPKGTLGQRYTIVYVVPGPNGIKSRVVQSVYPYAKPVPLTYMRPGQTFWGSERAHGGWFVASADLKFDARPGGAARQASQPGRGRLLDRGRDRRDRGRGRADCVARSGSALESQRREIRRSAVGATPFDDVRTALAPSGHVRLRGWCGHGCIRGWPAPSQRLVEHPADRCRHDRRDDGIARRRGAFARRGLEIVRCRRTGGVLREAVAARGPGGEREVDPAAAGDDVARRCGCRAVSRAVRARAWRAGRR